MMRSRKTDEQLQDDLDRAERGLRPLSWPKRVSLFLGAVLPVGAGMLSVVTDPAGERLGWLLVAIALSCLMILWSLQAPREGSSRQL